MADKSAAKFWVKHIILALIVIAAAIFVLRYNPENVDSASQQDTASKENIEDNLASFYQEFRLSSKDPIQEQYGDFVIALEAPESNQSDRLLAITSVEQPLSESWEGEFKFRSFAKDTTIRTEALKYAEEEGVTLIWDLNQDFIIRQRFLTENSLVGSLDEVAGAIDANFIPEVNVYFCNKKNTIVVAEKAGPYVLENCKKAGFE